MGFLDGIINSITSPLGVKLFPGGPYKDNGFGQKAQQAVTGPMTPISDLGALGQLPQVYGQIAKMTGVPDFLGAMPSPITPGMPAQSNDPNKPGIIATNSINQDRQNTLNQQIANFDPNKFSTPNQNLFNNMASQNAIDKNTALSRIQARLSARGLGDSSSMAAAQAYLEQAYGGNLRNQELGLLENQQGQQQNALLGQANAMGNLYNAQRQRMLDAAGVYNTAGQQAIANNNNSMGQLGGLLSILTGGRPLGDVFGGGSRDQAAAQDMPIYGPSAAYSNPYYGLGSIDYSSLIG